MAITFVRIWGAVVGIAAAVLTVVSLPLLLLREGWYWSWYLLDGHVPVAEIPPALSGFSHIPPFSWMGMSLPAPPEYFGVLAASAYLLIPLGGVLTLVHLAVPMRQRIRAVTGHTPVRLRKHNETYQRFIDQHSPRWKRRKIDLYGLPVQGVAAFALSAPFNRHAIVLSEELLTSTPEHIVKWILAHELAHIRYGDTVGGSFWVLTMRSIRVFAWLRNWIAMFGLKLVAELPVIRLLFWPLHLIVKLVVLTGRVGGWIGTNVFLLFDRWASRQMEYRADRYAANVMGVEPGVQLFQALQKIGSFEPTFRLFATHPSHARRIEALLAVRNAPGSEVPL